MVDLTGAVDLHVHTAPDSFRQRSVDALEAAQEAAEAGFAALVLKCHEAPTAQLAAIVDKIVSGIRIYGGVVCDYEIGGLNPGAVWAALRLGARIVWMPTLVSPDSGGRFTFPKYPVSVLNDRGRLSKEASEILSLVVEFDAIAATGHTSLEEHYALAREFGKRGKLIVTHAREPHVQPNLNPTQCAELAELGAFIELCAQTCIGTMASREVPELAECVRHVGPERCVLSSDLGQLSNPHPVVGLQAFADALLQLGVAEQDIRTMACENPRSLVGL